VAQSIRWDCRDMIRALDLKGRGWAYYNYDAGKQRSRKVIENQSGAKQWERIYLGGMEIYRRYSGGDIVEEIESFHLFEGEQRVLLIDDVLQTDNPNLPTGPLYRYQYSNHLGSACLEADDQAALISYEEYHPYGTSAYRARKSDFEAQPKRYRYTGMERDDESGLSYHTARFFAQWLGRWISSDPGGLKDGVNLYAYVNCNPCSRRDKTGTIGEPEQLHLTEQTPLRQDVTATMTDRGYGSWLRKSFQALGSQWMRGPIDVGDPENMPF